MLRVGDRRREPDGDARPVPVGQDRHRHRQEPARSCAASTSRSPSRSGLWLQAEAIAIATDLAEFVGAAIALNLLFGVPPFVAGLMTAVVAFAILELQTRGLPQVRARDRRLPRRSSSSASCTTCCRSAWTRGDFAGGLIPHFDGTDSVLLAVGILGATVMPHVVYLHSALTSAPDHAARPTTSGASCCASSASTSCSRWASPGSST